MIKNKYIKKILVMACIFSSINISTGYANINESYNFQNITIEDGLSQSTVEAIHQDSKGYMWIGTNDGLNRYNGYEFKHYKYNKDNKNSIAHNYIVDIIEDNNGYIWIATINGLSRINVEKDEIKNYYSDRNNGNLSDVSLRKILYTTEGKLLVSSINGLNLYDEQKDSFNRVLSKENELPSQLIYSVKEDSKGHIWVGTDKGLVELDKDLNLVKSYQDTIGDSEVYNLYDDSKGSLWVCTMGNGLFRINLDNKSVKNYKHSENKSSIASDFVTDAISDSKGRLWFGTRKGLCLFNYKTEKFITYNKDACENNALIDNMVFCLFKDKSGLIWIGTYKGVSTFSPDAKFMHYKSSEEDDNSISGDVIRGIYKDEDNLVWMGTSEQGVNIMNGYETKYLNKDNSNLLSNIIRDITGYKNKIFIGTNDGLSVLIKDKESYTIKNYTQENGLPSNKIRSLFVDSKGNLWIGTNNGIAILTSDDKIIDITYMLLDMGVTDKYVMAVYEDSKGNYYIGCFLRGGLIKINPKAKEYKVYKHIENDETSISNNGITFINEDLNGNILVGTNYGLNILNPKTNTFTSYTEEDGLINNTVYGVLVDNNNNLWMSTNAGISKLCTKESSFENFTISDGLQSNEFNIRASFKTDSGYMYFGGINGFNVFDPNEVQISKFEPKIIFDRFEVNGLKRKDISNTELKSNENNIKISFFTNDYISTNKTQYYYKLDGQSKDWNRTKNNSIVFANLNSGNYTLRIKAKTQHGVVGEESVVKFKIKQPFWKSMYANCLYILVAVIWIIITKYKVKKLDKQVNERTKDLKVQMEENKELYKEHEKLLKKVITLEQNKNNHFVNLSHELRTPLNVLNSINQLIKECCKSDSFITPERLSYHMDTMKINTNMLLNLINNIIDNTKIETNSYVLNKIELDIVYLVEEKLFGMKDYIAQNGLEFIFDTDVEEKTILCGETEIERCIVNLVANAVKFTDEGGLIQVTINDLDDKVKISVKDNGIGISEENKELIFNRFNQVTDNSQVKKGSGLGLTICKQLINLHGGEIYVESELGVGSEFIIILPVNND